MMMRRRMRERVNDKESVCLYIYIYMYIYIYIFGRLKLGERHVVSEVLEPKISVLVYNYYQRCC